METRHDSTFRQAVIVSELLTEDQLAHAIAEVEAMQKDVPEGEDISDEDIGDRLVELGWLNRWQVEQLQEGRTKFTLGPYRILDSIGKGGMGHVFKGEHGMLGRIEAVKVLPKSKTTPEAIETFQREIRAQAQFDHPNLVRVSYADRDGDTYFFVTEYVPGADLRRLVRRYGRLTMNEAATIISQAAQALHYSHKQGLVHRDVKPGNLLVTPDGLTKVTDLGLAWFLQDEEIGDAKTDKVVGTADYLAPEAIRSPKKIGPAADIYSLGCTLYYAVTGKVPFPGGRMADKIRRHLEEVPLNPRRFNPDLSDMFLDVLADMMEKDPARRISNAGDVVRRLRPWTLSSVILGPADGREEMTARIGQKERSSLGRKEMRDTATDSDMDESPSQSSEGVSQASQGTLKASSWREETLSADDDWSSEFSTSRLIQDARRLPRMLVIAVLIAVSMVVSVIVAILWGSK